MELNRQRSRRTAQARRLLCRMWQIYSHTEDSLLARKGGLSISETRTLQLCLRYGSCVEETPKIPATDGVLWASRLQ